MILMLTILVTGCAGRTPIIINPEIDLCPEFPLPSERVIQIINAQSESDMEMKFWFNDIRRLKEKLDRCHEYYIEEGTQ